MQSPPRDQGHQARRADAGHVISTKLTAMLELIRDSDIHELELEENGVRIRLHRSPPVEGALPEGATSESTSDLEIPLGPVAIRAPLVGTFYRAGKPGVPPLVSEGSRVEQDTVVGIIEALHELTDVEAGCRGLVTRVFATDGQPVEYGQPLFEVSRLDE